MSPTMDETRDMMENADFEKHEYYCHDCGQLHDSENSLYLCARIHPSWIQVSKRDRP